MYGCESWPVKRAEHQKIDAFDLWCWRRLFESPLDSKEIQPVHPKEDESWVLIGKIDAEAETPILWPPHAKSWLIGKDSNAGRDLGQEEKGTERGWDDWMVSPIRWTWVWVDSGSWWWIGRPGMLQFMRSQRVRHDWATELNWTERNIYCASIVLVGCRAVWIYVLYESPKCSSLPFFFLVEATWHRG